MTQTITGILAALLAIIVVLQLIEFVVVRRWRREATRQAEKAREEYARSDEAWKRLRELLWHEKAGADDA